MNPLTSPQPGDVVQAVVHTHSICSTVSSRRVRREVISSHTHLGAIEILFRDSRYANAKCCGIQSWRSWCKKHNAEVVR